MTPPRLILILSENHTLVPPRDPMGLVRMAMAAEDAGFDGVMVSEHIALGSGADSEGVPENPRDYAFPANQDPSTPWPSSIVLLSAVAAATTSIRLVAGAVIPPLRHPLLIAKDLATLDLLSRGRLVVQPTVSWHRAEYAALGVPFSERGARLDEHLAAWSILWKPGPSTYEGRFYRFSDTWLEPKPFRQDGPRLWFGGQSLHDRLLGRLVRYGHGFDPLGRPSDQDMERLASSMAAAGRAMADLELVGGTRGRFEGPGAVADLDEALASIPEQVERGFSTICIKPSQFTDDPAEISSLCHAVVEQVATLVQA
jgi:probable F420-dependent oxidoreductase